MLTQDRLDSYVPIGNAAMDDRTFIEWDKDDVDALRMMKVDVLALGMLTCIRKCFDLIDHAQGKRCVTKLETVPQDDEERSTTCCCAAAESLGVFQVESRAQMNMLPRLKPRTFYDLVIEVAIVRPGPIQGDMVHPYLKRRKMDPDKIEYPYPKGGNKDELRNVLHKTLGVPLFQEQAMRIAIEAADSHAGGSQWAAPLDGDGFRNVGTIGKFEDKMIGNMIARGYKPEFARNCFEQIKGFGSYGFPESHAASFAQLVYVSSWLKHHHPDAFCCGLLNSQPMGFYAPAQIVGDARKNGVEVREIDVSHSFAENTLEEGNGKYCAVRLGFRQIDGFGWIDRDEERLKQIQLSFRGVATISPSSFRGAPQSRITSPRNAVMDSGLVALSPAPGGEVLKKSHRLGRSHHCRTPAPPIHLAGRLRPRHWLAQARADPARRRRCVPLARTRPPRGAVGGAALARRRAAAACSRRRSRASCRTNGRDLSPQKPRAEHVVADYQTIRLSLKGHPMEFLRTRFAREGIAACREVCHANDRRRLRCAGVVLVRQRPGSAKGVVFMTLEDETGIANIVVWPKVMEQFRKEVMGARLVLVEGYVQSSPEAGHASGSAAPDRPLAGSDRPVRRCLRTQASNAAGRRPDRAAQRRPPRTSRQSRAAHPPPARRPHPAQVAGFSLDRMFVIREGPRAEGHPGNVVLAIARHNAPMR